MNAIAWFAVSLLLFAFGAYLALFTVTTHKGLNAWVCLGFFAGAFINLGLILVIVLKP